MENLKGVVYCCGLGHGPSNAAGVAHGRYRQWVASLSKQTSAEIKDLFYSANVVNGAFCLAYDFRWCARPNNPSRWWNSCPTVAGLNLEISENDEFGVGGALGTGFAILTASGWRNCRLPTPTEWQGKRGSVFQRFPGFSSVTWLLFGKSNTKRFPNVKNCKVSKPM